MKKSSTNVLAILLALSMVLSPMSTVYAESGTGSDIVSGEAEYSAPNDTGDKLKDGSYPIKTWSFKKASGTSKRTFTMNDTLEVRDGIAYVTLTVDSASYTYVVLNGVQYEVTINGNNSTFEIPTELDKDVTLSLYSSSMETLIDYTMNVSADVQYVVEGTEAIWQDGYYIGTGNVTRVDESYFKSDYEVRVAVEIKDNKIVNVKYADEIDPENGNISYMKWAMDGCHVYKNNECTYLTGVAAQVVESNSADEIDVVSGATRVSLGIQEGVKAALKKAETGDKDVEDSTPVVPEPEDKIAEEGVYTVDTVSTGVTVIDAQLTSKDGKMTALITLSGTGYDYLYFGNEDEAHEAGESAWCGIVGTKEYVREDGKTKTGAQYLIPVESLDKELKFISHAKSSGKWFYRTINFDSASLVVVDNSGQVNPEQNKPNQDKPGQADPNPDKSDSKNLTVEKPIKTGDTMGPIYVWALLCILSVSCAITLFVRRKNNI